MLFNTGVCVCLCACSASKAVLMISGIFLLEKNGYQTLPSSALQASSLALPCSTSCNQVLCQSSESVFCVRRCLSKFWLKIEDWYLWESSQNLQQKHRFYFSLNYILTNISRCDNYLLDEIYFFNHITCSKTLFLVFSPWADLLMTPCKLRNEDFSLPAFNIDEAVCLGLLTQTRCKLP